MWLLAFLHVILFVMACCGFCGVLVGQVELKARRLLYHYEQSIAATKRGSDKSSKSHLAKGRATQHSEASDKQMMFLEVRV